MKWFSEKEYLVGRRYLLAQIFRLRAGRPRNDHDIDIRVDFPNLLRCLDSVYAWRHFDVEEYNRKRVFVTDRFRDSVHRGLTMVARLDLEFCRTRLVGVLAEQYLFEVAQRRSMAIWRETLSKASHVLADQHGVVVDDQYAIQ